MSTSAQLGNLLNVTADLNYYTMMLNQWSAKYEANSEKLQAQTKYEEKFIGKVEDAQDPDKQIKCAFGTKEKGEVWSEAKAEQYGHYVVKQYDESLSLELAELDIEYDTMKTMYETLVTQMKAWKESATQSTAAAAGQTNLLQS